MRYSLNNDSEVQGIFIYKERKHPKKYDLIL